MNTLKPPLPLTIIYDFGANNILKIPFYLFKSNLFVAVEGNPSLPTLLLKKTIPKQELIYKNLPDDDLIQRRSIIELGNSKINGIAKVNLEEGLEKTINYFKQEVF